MNFSVRIVKTQVSYWCDRVIFQGKNARIVGHPILRNSFQPSLQPHRAKPKAILNAPEIQVHVGCVSG